MKKWTMEDLETHIKENLDNSYSAAIIVGAYHKVVFGNYPKIGLSGHQASAIDLVVQKIEELRPMREIKVPNASSTISKEEITKSFFGNHSVQIIRVFEVDVGITYWIVANSEEQCVEFMKTTLDLEPEQLENYSISECSNERVLECTFIDDDGNKGPMIDELNRKLMTQVIPFELAVGEI